MAQESPDIPHNMRKIYRRFERWRGAHTGPPADSGALVGGCSGAGSGARGFRTAQALHLEYG